MPNAEKTDAVLPNGTVIYSMHSSPPENGAWIGTAPP
jgi:hypothetical protein